MFQLTEKNIDFILLGLLLLLSSYLCYEVSLMSFNLLNFEFPFISKMGSFFSALIPLTIFLFYLITTNYMLALFDLEFKFLSIIRIVSICYFPILISQAITFFILIDLDKNNFSYEYTYLQSNFFGCEIKQIIDFFEYLWVLFYVIFIILLKKEYELNIKKTLVICLTPTLIILIFNYLWKFI